MTFAGYGREYVGEKEMISLHNPRIFSTSRIIMLGFLGVILTGTLLLMLPFATKTPGGASFLDALFTATSATCVTGLIVQDTATYWSEFGQIVILLLIQIGGLGVVTVAVAIALFSGKKIGLMQRTTLQEAISAPNVGGIVKLTGFILRSVAVIELTGAILLAIPFVRDYGLLKGIWYGIFHSISAFCNAGFDLMGFREKFSSLTYYSGDVIVNLVIMLLIIIGGLGFLSWEDVRTHRFHIQRYRMQTKIIFSVTAFLLVVPFFYFLFVEFSGAQWESLSIGEKILAAMFQTVSPRTAGFNTVDLNALKESGQAVTILLMLIGGSPGSTAGGMKTTTIAVLLLTAFAVFNRKDDAQCFGRRIAKDVVVSAATIFIMFVSLVSLGAIVISCVDGVPMLDAMFETASAIATVGLTLGITTELSMVSRLVLITLMFIGRVGGLTLIFATISAKQTHLSKMPQEKITVG